MATEAGSEMVAATENPMGSERRRASTVFDSVSMAVREEAGTTRIKEELASFYAETQKMGVEAAKQTADKLIEKIEGIASMKTIWYQHEKGNFLHIDMWLSDPRGGLSMLEKATFITLLMQVDEESTPARWPVDCSCGEICRYLTERFQNGSLFKFITGDLSSDDAEGAVNTFSLINALFVSIPYGVISAFNPDQWNGYVENLKSCDLGENFDVEGTFLAVYEKIFNTIFGAIYSSVISLIIAMIFYVLKPRADRAFKKWWGFGKYAVFLIFLGTVASIVQTLTIAGIILNAPNGFYTTSDHLCSSLRSSSINFSIAGAIAGNTVLGVTVFLSIFFML